MTDSQPLPAGVATGVGSMPGDDFAEAMRIVLGELPDLPHLSELPSRSAGATLVGRAVALLVGLGADLQPAGWRLTDRPGVDHRRARSLLAADLDLLEELARDHTGSVKVQVAGPWTLAAGVERPRGDRVLGDPGARRDLAQSLAEGVTQHIRDVRRRLPRADVIVQVDEPALPAVLAGQVPTASGFHRHRSVERPPAAEALRWVADAVHGVDAVPVVHCCAASVPVSLLIDAGFRALSIDAGLIGTEEYDAYAAALASGVGLWLGVVPATEPTTAPPSDSTLSRKAQQLFDELGHDPATFKRLGTVTPTCGLAGASPAWTREALRLSRQVAHNLVGAVSEPDGRMSI